MVWVIVGAVLQIVGLVCAAVGLGQVWAENPQPENLSWRIFGPSIRWVNTRVLRRPRHVTVNVGSANMTLTAVALSAYGTVGLNPDSDPTEQITQVKREVDAAGLRAHQAHVLAERTDKRVTDLEARLAAEVARVQSELETARKADAADAVPLSTIGLAVTALGTVVGLVGSLVTASG